MKVFCVALALVCSNAAATESFPSLRKHGLHKKASFVSAKTSPSKAQVASSLQQFVDAPQVSVPAPPDAGKDGMPLLPDVPDMVSGAVQTLKSISQQASVLETRAVQVQEVSAMKMVKMKAYFEENLKKREQENLQVVAANKVISKEIEALKKDSTARRKHATELVQANKFMRSEVRALEQRLGAAKDFAVASLKATDDRQAKELTVLDTTKANSTQAAPAAEVATEKKTADKSDKADKSSDDDDDDEDDDDAAKATSFVSMESRHHHGLHAVHKPGHKAAAHKAAADKVAHKDVVSASAEDGVEETLDLAAVPADEAASKSPADIVKELNAGVAHIAEEQVASESRAKALFAKDVAAETARHDALVHQQHNLNATRSSLKELQAELDTAETHLTATKKQLTERLHNLGLFVQHLSHLALAPEAEAPRLLQALPEKVSEPASQPVAEAAPVGGA